MRYIRAHPRTSDELSLTEKAINDAYRDIYLKVKVTSGNISKLTDKNFNIYIVDIVFVKVI